MHEFRVWAPRAGAVDVVLSDVVPGEVMPGEVMPGERRLPMTRAGRGWWTRVAGDAGPGTDYAFSLDGGPPRPDPRSACQPRGVHGPSRVVDHAAFDWNGGSPAEGGPGGSGRAEGGRESSGWSEDRWRGLPLAGSVLYECHIGTFSAAGTFDGAIDHLDHLAALGVDAIELMPVAEFPGERGWGYDGTSLFAPHHAYGGPDGLKRLVRAAHARGIGVIMDVVYNHVGPDGNYLPEFGPYFSARHQTDWGDGVNFDGPGSDEVRRFVIDNALMWLRDYHCDGLRLDAVHAIADESATHILEALAAEVAALAAHLRRRIVLVAESDLNDPRLVRSHDAGGYGLDAAWADDWHHALHAALTHEKNGYYADFGPIRLLAKALRQAWVYDGVYSPHRQRVHGRPVTGLAGSQFVVAAQNHDQIGNRAAGERASALMTDGRLRIAAALLLTSPFVPMLFQGEEWGASTPFQYFTDHLDPGLGRAVSEGRRREFAVFGWDPADVPDPQDAATFLRCKLDWDEARRGPHAGLLAWYRRLIALRREIPELTDPRLGRVETEYDENAGWLVIRRRPVVIASNLGTGTWIFPAAPSAELIVASSPGAGRTRRGVALPPDTVAILTEASPS